MTTYYRIDNRKLSWAECGRFGKGLALPLLGFCKLFRIRLDLDQGLPFPVRLAEMKLEKDNLPERVRAVFEAPLRDLQGLGFRVMWFGEFRTTLQPSQLHLADLLHEGGEVAARVMYTLNLSALGGTEMLTTPFLTGFPNGRVLATSNMFRTFDRMPFVTSQCHVGALPAKLWAIHTAALEQARLKEAPLRFRTPSEYEQFVDDHEQRCSEHNIRRGLYAEMTPHEVEAARRRRESLYPATPPPLTAPTQG